MLSNSGVGAYVYPLGSEDRPHTPLTVDGSALAYDANGNMTLGLAGKVITYNYANEPTQVVFAGQTTDYTYGPGAIRQTKTVDGVTTFYTSIAEIRNFGTATEQIILQPRPDFRITDAGAANEAVSYLHRDHLASVRLITNAAGNAEQSNNYTPFGDPDTTPLLATATPEEHSFIGERYDSSTGLLFLNARYYDPDLGRFLQPDWWEVRRPGVGTNRYAYSFNDPINMSDRNGHFVCKETETALACVGTATIAATKITLGFVARTAGGAITFVLVGSPAGSCSTISCGIDMQMDLAIKVGVSVTQEELEAGYHIDGDGNLRDPDGLEVRGRTPAGPNDDAFSAWRNRQSFDNASYHGRTQNGRKNPAPSNPDAAFSASYRISGNSPRRIAFDNRSGEFVIFDRTSASENLWHGHTRTWNELRQRQKNALIRAGVVDRRGNAL